MLKNDVTRRLLRTDIQPSIGLFVHHSPFAGKLRFAAHSPRPGKRPIHLLLKRYAAGLQWFD